MSHRLLTTSEVMAMFPGLSRRLVAQWRKRGFLKLAPRGKGGEGQGNQLKWTTAAVLELKRYAARPHQPNTLRTHHDQPR